MGENPEPSLFFISVSLLLRFMKVLAPLCPSVGKLHGGCCIIPCSRIWRAFVKTHYNVSAEELLNLHSLFRAQEVFRAVQMGLEIYPFILYLAQFAVAENLIAPAVRKYGPVPVHESVQAAHIPYKLVTRPQVEMVCIAKDYLYPDLLELFRCHGLHSCLRAYRHKHRGADLTMAGCDFTESGPRMQIFFYKPEFKYHSFPQDNIL